MTTESGDAEKTWREASTYTRYHGLLDRLSGYKRESVERLTDQAIGYVWGFQDAGGEVKDSNRATDFGWRFGIVCARVELEEISGRGPIQDAWVSWQKHGEIRDYNGRRLDKDE